MTWWSSATAASWPREPRTTCSGRPDRIVRATHRDSIVRALAEAGLSSSPVGPDGLLAQADVAHVWQIALAAGVAVTELRPADGAGLEEMFLELTAETQRETTNHNQPEGAVA